MSKDAPLLSFCVPTYNRADLLEYCINNLQEFEKYNIPFEIVVCDHASTDHTPKIMEKAEKKWDNVRIYRQTKRIVIQQAIYTPMRLAKGKYTIYMADDDKLLLDKVAEYVKYMEDNPDIVTTYAPWWAYDDDKEEIIHGYFEVDEVKVFSREDPLEYYSFMTQKVVFPEMAVYRTECLQKVLVYFDEAAVNIFQVAYGLLRLGKVAFQTDPFYLEVAKVKSKFSQNERMNVAVNLSGLDRTRASLEITLERMLLDLGQQKVSDSMRQNLHEILLAYLHNRLTVAFNRALGRGNYLMATECAQRVMLWRGIYKDDLLNISNQIYLPAGIHAVVNLYNSVTWLKEMVIFGFNKPEEVVEVIEKIDPDIKAVVLSKEEIVNHKDPESIFVLVKMEEDKEQFLDTEILPGNIASLHNWAEFFKIVPAQRNIDTI